MLNFKSLLCSSLNPKITRVMDKWPKKWPKRLTLAQTGSTSCAPTRFDIYSTVHSRDYWLQRTSWGHSLRRPMLTDEILSQWRHRCHARDKSRFVWRHDGIIWAALGRLRLQRPGTWWALSMKRRAGRPSRPTKPIQVLDRYLIYLNDA